METRYAKKDIYAEVEEEGGKINRLVAAAGQPVPPGYADLVDKSDTQEKPLDGSELAAATLDRSTSVRKETPAPEEVSHDEFRETAALAGIPEVEREQAKRPSRSRSSAKSAK